MHHLVKHRVAGNVGDAVDDDPSRFATRVRVDGGDPSREPRRYPVRAAAPGTDSISRRVYQWVGFDRIAVRGTVLNRLPSVQDVDPVGDLTYDREVVRDEQVADPQLCLEVAEQVQDLCLDGHVERRHRLVAHEQRRLHGEGPRDCHSWRSPPESDAGRRPA